MSREIKFRIWDKVSNRMIYSSEPEEQGKREYLFLEFCVGFSHWKRDNLSDPMQFTGLKDANGAEIYEGDLMEAKDYWGEGDYAEVAWYEEQGAWGLKRNGRFYEPLRPPFADGHFAFVIVGNIYKAPALVRSAHDA